MSNLFISHSSADNVEAKKLQEKLEEQGHRSVFLDLDPQKGIAAGVSWERTLYTKLRACRAVVALCSDSYLASQWCFAEVALARMEGKELFVLQIDPWSERTQMPSILTEEQFIDLRTHREEGYRRLWNGFKVKGIVPEEHREWNPEEPPYPGLRAFDVADEPIFFGRDQEVREGVELLNRVRRQGHPRMVMVLGSSGSGKSSLTRAGIVPRLLRDGDRWLVVGPLRPGPRPAVKLAVALAQRFEEAGKPRAREEILRLLDAGEKATPAETATAPQPSAAEMLREALIRMEAELKPEDAQVLESVKHLKEHLDASHAAPRAASAPLGIAAGASPLAALASELRLDSGRPDAKVVLVVDQFEELLGHEEAGDDHPANRFLGVLKDGIESEEDPPLCLGTMRSDFLGMLQRSGPLRGVGFKSLSVGPMSEEGMLKVVEEPATLGQIDLQKPELTHRLLRETGTSDALPLLAFTLRAMWDRYHETRRFDIQGYEALGGLQGAIAQVADDTLEAALAKSEGGTERELRIAFLSLARPAAEGSGWARRPVNWDEMPARVQPMIQQFIDQRLLVKRADGTVEVAHEALFRSWEKLRGWLNANAEGLLLRREIQAEAKKWDEAGSQEDKEPYLWRGGRLARALELRRGGVLTLSQLEESFVEASEGAELARIEAKEAQRRRELRQARIFATVVSAAFLIAVGLGIFAWFQKKKAVEQGRIASAGRLASLSTNNLDNGLDLALLLSVQAHRTAPTLEALNSLATSMSHSPRLVRFLYGHTGKVRGVAFSPDGSRLASASFDKTIRMWDPVKLEPAGVLGEHEADVNKVAFSPDGSRLASTSDDGTIRLWDPERPGEPVKVLRPGEPDTGSAYKAVFSADGGLLASAHFDGRVRLWDVARGVPTRKPLDGHNSAVVLNVALSPDGKLLASGSRDRTVILWDPESGRRLGDPLRGDPRPENAIWYFGFVEGLAFSPDRDSRLLVSAGRDRKIRFWDVGADPVALLGSPAEHTAPVLDVAFSPDGKVLASANYDGTLRLWEVATRRALGGPLKGHVDLVYGVAYSPDGKLLASASYDRKIGIWNAERPSQPLPSLWQPRAIAAHAEGVSSVSFRPDGRRLASGGYDGTIGLWNVTNGEAVGPPLAGHEDSVATVAFSPDGRWLASGGNDGRVVLWDLAADSPQRVGAPLEHDEAVESVAFSGDGKRLATGGRDHKVRLWNVETREPIGAPIEHERSVYSVALDPDGGLLAVGLNKDLDAPEPPAIYLWDLRHDSPRSRPLVGHTHSAVGLAFSSDGELLASASFDQTVRLWDVERGEPMGEPLVGHGRGVYSVAFSPDGRRLASASHDKTLRLWDVATGQAVGPPLAGHGDLVESVSFHPHEPGVLASAGFDGTIHLWNVDESSWPERACAIANRNLKRKEWEQFIGKDVPYCRTCPGLPAPEPELAGAEACEAL